MATVICEYCGKETTLDAAASGRCVHCHAVLAQKPPAGDEQQRRRDQVPAEPGTTHLTPQQREALAQQQESQDVRLGLVQGVEPLGPDSPPLVMPPHHVEPQKPKAVSWPMKKVVILAAVVVVVITLAAVAWLIYLGWV